MDGRRVATFADTLANFYGFDMLVHRWDLARALGQDLTYEDAPRQVRLLGRMGRRA